MDDGVVRPHEPEPGPARISFPAIVGSVRRAVVDFDMDTVRTVVGLTRCPGPTVRRYLDFERGR